MPIFSLNTNPIQFPPPDFAGPDGLLAEGGLCTSDWLFKAYYSGFFCWSHPMRYPKWWTPDPRKVILPQDYKLNFETDKNFTTGFNNDLDSSLKFIQGIENQGEMNDFWLTGIMMNAFKDFHKTDNLIWITVKKAQEIVAVALGVAINNLFFGEYISGKDENVMRHAGYHLLEYLKQQNFILFDVHKPTNRGDEIFKVSLIGRRDYLTILENNLT